ncbi:hypothetical protein Barb4_05358 [Bacteroidales bacterium Barb4]|nr:hypothetical protein Barb4_05358 [Bacteroidales bacterium Barb4]
MSSRAASSPRDVRAGLRPQGGILIVRASGRDGTLVRRLFLLRSLECCGDGSNDLLAACAGW